MKKLSRSKAQIDHFRAVLASGGSLHSAMLACGYSQLRASKSAKELPAKLKKIYDEEMALRPSLEQLGERVEQDPQWAARVVKGRVMQNNLDGVDRATRSAKLAGELKELDCYIEKGIIGKGGEIIVNLGEVSFPDSFVKAVLETNYDEPSGTWEKLVQEESNPRLETSKVNLENKR